MSDPTSDRDPRPRSTPPAPDTTLGQRVTSALVDVVFFAVVWSLAREHVVEGQAVVGLLSSYAAWRFGIAHGKQQTIVAMSRQHDRDGGGPGAPPPSIPRPPRDPRVEPDHRTDRPWSRRLALVEQSPLLSMLRTIGGLLG